MAVATCDAVGVGHAPEAVGDLALLLQRLGLVVGGVGLVVAHQHVDVAVERGREEHRLALLVGQVEQAPHLGEEAHVGHAVGLVDDDDVDVVEAERAALEEVLEAAGGGDDDLDALAERLHLALHAGAAVDGEHLGLGAPAQGHELLLHLRGELTGGHEHEALGPAGRGLLDAGEQREAEGDGLAGAGGRLAADVAAGEGVGERGGLDGERLGDAEDVEALAQAGGHAEVGEGGGHGGGFSCIEGAGTRAHSKGGSAGCRSRVECSDSSAAPGWQSQATARHGPPAAAGARSTVPGAAREHHH